MVQTEAPGLSSATAQEVHDGGGLQGSLDLQLAGAMRSNGAGTLPGALERDVAITGCDATGKRVGLGRVLLPAWLRLQRVVCVRVAKHRESGREYERVGPFETLVLDGVLWT